MKPRARVQRRQPCKELPIIIFPSTVGKEAAKGQKPLILQEVSGICMAEFAAGRDRQMAEMLVQNCRPASSSLARNTLAPIPQTVARNAPASVYLVFFILTCKKYTLMV